MEIEELKGLVEAQGRAFEEFKKNNDAAIEAKAKGVADPLFEEKSKRITDALDELGDKIKKLEVKANRPGACKEQGLTDDEIEHKAAYQKWLRKGEEVGLEELERKAMSVGSSADGGFAVPKVIDQEIIDVLVNISPIRSIATVRQISTPNFNILADVNGTQSGWVGETATRSATNTPQLANITPTMGELYANPQATQQVLDDTMFDVEAWLAQSVSEEFARAEGAAFISGDGTNKPTGFLAGTPVATADGARAFGALQYVPSGQAAALPTSLDTFISLVQALKAGHRQGAVWVMSKALVGSIRQYKSSTNEYLWQPSVQAGAPSTFLGYPVIEAEDMPAVAANAFPVAFGNFKAGYVIVDRMGVRTLRDPYTNKPYVGFYTTKRVGGIVANSEAIKLLKIAAS